MDLLSETVLHLTLTDETVEPVTIPIHVKHDKGQTTAHVPNQHVVDLYNGTRWNELPAFTTDFLQAIMCEMADNELFQNQVRDAIASHALETMTETSTLELNQMFGGYLEEHLDDINFTIQLNFRYRFLSTNQIELTAKADTQVQNLITELEGTENRIFVARNDYNEVATTYNNKIRRFPTNMIAGMFGFEKVDLVKADEKAKTTVPSVNLNNE